MLFLYIILLNTSAIRYTDTFLHIQGFFGQGTLSSKGFDYDRYSKRIADHQMRRKENWRKMVTSLSGGAGTSGAASSSLSTDSEVTKFVYVVRNGHEEEEEEETFLQEDPYPVQECLELMPEEALFLSFGLGCLVVKDEEDKPLTIDVSHWNLISSTGWWGWGTEFQGYRRWNGGGRGCPPWIQA